MLQCFGELRIGAVMWVGLKVPVDKSGKRGSVKFNCRGCVVTESQEGEGGGGGVVVDQSFADRGNLV